MRYNPFEKINNQKNAVDLARMFTCLVFYGGRNSLVVEAQLFAMLRYHGGGLDAILEGAIFHPWQSPTGFFCSDELKGMEELRAMAFAYLEGAS